MIAVENSEALLFIQLTQTAAQKRHHGLVRHCLPRCCTLPHSPLQALLQFGQVHFVVQLDPVQSNVLSKTIQKYSHTCSCGQVTINFLHFFCPSVDKISTAPYTFSQKSENFAKPSYTMVIFIINKNLKFDCLKSGSKFMSGVIKKEISKKDYCCYHCNWLSKSPTIVCNYHSTKPNHLSGLLSATSSHRHYKNVASGGA